MNQPGQFPIFGKNVMWWVVLFALAVIAYVGLEGFIRTRPAPTASRDASARREEPPLVSETMPAARQNVLSPDLTDPSVLSASATGQLPDSAFRYLLYQMKTTNPAAVAAEAKPVEQPSDFERIRTGEAVSIEGTLASIQRRDKWGVPDADINDVIQCEIRDAKGRLYLVFTVNDMLGVDHGDHVKVVGRFLRMYPYVAVSPDPSALPPAEGEKPKPSLTPVVVAKELEAPQLLDAPSALAEVEDQNFSLDPKAFYCLIHKIQGMTQEELKAQADLALTDRAILINPAAARGKVVAVQGTLKLVNRRNERPNIAGVDHMYRCFLSTKDGQRAFVYMLDNPANVELGGTVKVYGIFMKVRLYDSQASQELSAMVLFAKELVPVEIKTSSSLGWIAVIIVVIIAGAVGLAILNDRRSSRRFAQEKNRILDRSKRNNGSVPPEPPK